VLFYAEVDARTRRDPVYTAGARCYGNTITSAESCALRPAVTATSPAALVRYTPRPC